MKYFYLVGIISDSNASKGFVEINKSIIISLKQHLISYKLQKIIKEDKYFFYFPSISFLAELSLALGKRVIVKEILSIPASINKCGEIFIMSKQR